LRHATTPEFWRAFNSLPPPIQAIARKNFELLKEYPRHPSLQLKKAGVYWSARVGLDYRAVAIEGADALVWFWIGPHDRYKQLLSKR
jgi:hypothetical protein